MFRGFLFPGSSDELPRADDPAKLENALHSELRSRSNKSLSAGRKVRPPEHENMIKYGLNGATTMPLHQETEIRLAGGAGFDLIELRVPKVEQYLKFGTLSHLKGLLSTNGLRILSLNAIERVNTRQSGKESELLEEGLKWPDGLEHWNALSSSRFLAFWKRPRPRPKSPIRRLMFWCLCLKQLNPIRCGLPLNS